jgi:hypothetical protein
LKASSVSWLPLLLVVVVSSICVLFLDEMGVEGMSGERVLVAGIKVVSRIDGKGAGDVKISAEVGLGLEID